MKKLPTFPLLRGLALALVLSVTSAALHAQVPQILNFQGRVTVGTPAVNFEGSGAFKFALVNGAGTTTFWSNDGTGNAGSQPTAAVSLPVVKGFYSVLLGDTSLTNMTAIPASAFANSDVRLRVWFNDGTNGSQLLTPDQRIAAVGYAMVAGTLQEGATIFSSTASPAVSLENTTDNPAALKLTTEFGEWWVGQNKAPDVGGLDQFFIYDKNADATRLRIDTDGVIHGNGGGLSNIPAVAIAPTPPGMALIPAGAFTMGNAVAADTDITDAAPVSTTMSAFYMDINEVTLSQWQSVYFWATSNGYSFAAGSGKGPNHPVHTVSWYDAVKWCNARSEQAGRTPVYYTNDAQTTIYRTGNVDVTNAQVNWTANGYRLPTEAEWEKAARGGRSGQRFPWGNTITQNLANYFGNTGNFPYDQGPNGNNAIGSVGGTSPATSPVGTFAASGYGLNDMAGNLFEWCWDRYGTPYAGGTDPRGPAAGSNRMIRGGSWYGGFGAGADDARCANRASQNPGFSDFDIGFRAVLTPGQ